MGQMERQSIQEMTCSYILPEISMVREHQWVFMLSSLAGILMPENSSSIQTCKDISTENLAALRDHNFNLCLSKHLLVLDAIGC